MFIQRRDFAKQTSIVIIYCYRIVRLFRGKNNEIERFLKENKVKMCKRYLLYVFRRYFESINFIIVEYPNKNEKICALIF